MERKSYPSHNKIELEFSPSTSVYEITEEWYYTKSVLSVLARVDDDGICYIRCITTSNSTKRGCIGMLG